MFKRKKRGSLQEAEQAENSAQSTLKKAAKIPETMKPASRSMLSALLKTGKPSGIQFTLQKRSRQIRHLSQIMQASIRILNALDKKTIYRH